jgi:hypothetical protein
LGSQNEESVESVESVESGNWGIGEFTSRVR